MMQDLGMVNWGGYQKGAGWGKIANTQGTLDFGASLTKPLAQYPIKMLPDIKPRAANFDPVTGFGRPLYTKRG